MKIDEIKKEFNVKTFKQDGSEYYEIYTKTKGFHFLVWQCDKKYITRTKFEITKNMKTTPDILKEIKNNHERLQSLLN